MDGKRGRDESPPLKVTFISPGNGGVPDVYVRSSQDPDGTLVYRKS